MKTPEDIIPDSEIERVHANANFGSMPKRSVVDEALLKAACGYHSGATAKAIIEEHGLINSVKRSGLGSLTARGRSYLWAVFSRSIP